MKNKLPNQARQSLFPSLSVASPGRLGPVLAPILRMPVEGQAQGWTPGPRFPLITLGRPHPRPRPAICTEGWALRMV